MPPPYESQVQPGQGTQFQVGIEAAPRLPGLTAQGEGLQQLGTATSALAQVMQASRDQTEELKFKTNFLTGLQGEAEKAQNSTDYANAPKNFGEAALKLKNDELGKITNPSKREELVFFAQQHTL